MAKQQKQIQMNVPGKGNVKQFESYDDTLLPPAIEMLKLKEVDPKCIDWLLERAAKEQDYRHSFQDQRIKLAERHEKREHRIDLCAIFSALIVIVLGMVLSYLLIEKGQLVLGSVFAGATLLLSANSFLNVRKRKFRNNQQQ